MKKTFVINQIVYSVPKKMFTFLCLDENLRLYFRNVSCGQILFTKGQMNISSKLANLEKSRQFSCIYKYLHTLNLKVVRSTESPWNSGYWTRLANHISCWEFASHWVICNFLVNTRLNNSWKYRECHKDSVHEFNSKLSIIALILILTEWSTLLGK